MLDGAYRINQTYVANNLCINKNNPQLRCDGKCYLSKQIENNAKSNAQPAGNKKEQSETAVCLLPKAFIIAPWHHENVVSYFYAAAVYLPGYVPSPFQPPRFSIV